MSQPRRKYDPEFKAGVMNLLANAPQRPQPAADHRFWQWHPW